MVDQAMQRLVLLSVLVGMAGLWASCGSSPGVEEEDEQPKEPQPVAVVFETDFFDVYGPIEVEVDGETIVTSDSEAMGDCDDPVARLMPGTEFRALSKYNFFWSGHVPSGEEDGCVTISLGVDELKSGVSGVYQNDPTCLPAKVSAALSLEGDEERPMGVIRSPWSYDASEFDFLPYAEPTRFMLQMARLGRLVVVGGGPPAPYGEAHWIWMRRASEQDGCRQMNWEFMAPREGRRLLWGLDPRDDWWGEGDDA